MTEKIVQLIDKDNNNVYPVAGSLKQGSVTTSTINNKAVTADKIDFSTIDSGWVNLTPTSKGTWNMLAYRLVDKFCYIYGHASSITFSDGEITTLPQAIRPSTQTPEVHCFADGTGGRKGRIIINSSTGSVAMGAFDNTSGSGYVTFNVGFFID